MAGLASRPAARRRRLGALTGALTAALALTLTACSSSATTPAAPAATQPPVPTVVTVAVSELPAGFNVHLDGAAGPTGGATRDVMGLLWPSAYRIRPDLTAEPWLLSAPATVISTDPFVVEWRIRPAANWSDGTPVTVDDLEFLYRRCAGLEGEPACADRDGYDQISAFEKLDAKTARITFDPPYFEFPNLFRWIPPSHVVGEAGEGSGWTDVFATDPGPSAGPFELVQRQAGESLVLERNDEYFGDDPEIDRLVVRQIEPGAQADAMRAGEVQVVVPPATLDRRSELEAVDGAEVRLGLHARAEVLVFNLDHELLAVPAVRRAIALGIGRAEMTEALVTPVNPDAEPLGNRVFLAGQPGHQGHGAEFDRRDVERARAELANAGFVQDPSGIFTLGEQRLALRISTTSGDVRREQAAQLVQAQLGDVGIDLTIDNAPAAELEARLAAGDFDVALVGRSMDAFPVSQLRATYGTDGARNWSRFSEPGVDELLASASATTDRQARAVVLDELDAALWEFLPDLPLFQPPFLLAHRESLDGVVPNATTQGFLWNVEAWRVSDPGS